MPPPRSARWIKPLASVCFGLALFNAGLAAMVLAGSGRPSLREAFTDRGVRDELIAELASHTRGVFDSHPDPDVGYRLLPRLSGVEFKGALLHTNSLGLREDEFALPKREGNVRVVLLGDSFVQGFGVDADDRMGVVLRKWLRAGDPDFAGRIEVLHVGVGGWNTRNECAFLRRQLSEFAPDLVVQLSVSNDLDDGTGVRGFGGRARFDSRRRDRADSRVYNEFTSELLGEASANYLIHGVDWESQHRFAEARDQVARLADEVEGLGAKYVFAGSWGGLNARLRSAFGPELGEERMLYVPSEFSQDRAHWVAPNDSHWNERGQELFATMLWAVIRERDLLPMLSLTADPERERRGRALIEAGHAEAHAVDNPWGLPDGVVGPRVDFRDPTREQLMQIHGGVDAAGHVSPYGSLLLAAPPDAAFLSIRGSALDRPELDGLQVRVFLNAVPIAGFELDASDPIDLRLPLPESVRGATWLSVRFLADDWGYRGAERQRCVAFRLDSVAIEP